MTPKQVALKCAEICDDNRRHVELSPGVGADIQAYGIAVCDDIATAIRDFAATPSDEGEVERLRVARDSWKIVAGKNYERAIRAYAVAQKVRHGEHFTIHDPEGQKRCGFPVDEDSGHD